jgi:nucleoside-diphosphate-sugar epimerase
MRILCTGGTGFIGQWLKLAHYEITPINELQYTYGDWDKQPWDYIIHLAPPLPARAIKCADKCGAKILYASSGAVYDRELNDYASGKLMGEAQLVAWGGEYSIARMFTFAGGAMRNHFAVINYIMDAMAGGPIRIRGDNVTRSYMYAGDMVKWLWEILLNGDRKIYEVGGSHPVNMYQLAQEVAKHFKPTPQIIYDRIYGPDARPVYLPLNAGETKAELGVEETVEFEDAIRLTVEWYKRYLHA